MSDSLATVVPSAIVTIEHLVERAADYAANAKSVNTRRAYATDFATFEAWCGAQVTPLPALPTTPEVVAVYVSAMADGGSKVSTIARALAGIGWTQRTRGHTWVITPTLAEVMKGIRRRLGTASAKKAPVRDAELKAMVGVLGVDLVGLRDRALLTVGWTGAFRRSELVALDVTDVQRTRDGLIVTVRSSKTDQEGRGEELAVPFAGDPAVCPVRTLEAWITASGITEGPIFRSIRRYGRMTTRRLSDRGVVVIVKRTAQRAGLDFHNLAGHSLRSGFATTAAAKGKSTRSIMKQGRWKLERTANGYVQHANLFVDNAAAGLV